MDILTSQNALWTAPHQFWIVWAGLKSIGTSCCRIGAPLSAAGSSKNSARIAMRVLRERKDLWQKIYVPLALRFEHFSGPGGATETKNLHKLEKQALLASLPGEPD